MRVPRHRIEARRRQLEGLLRGRAYVPVREVCEVLGVSEATARRDLAELEKEKKIRRTFGGALGEFNVKFESFGERLDWAREEKEQIAREMLKEVRQGMKIYLDSGTTIYWLADLLANEGVENVEVVTNNLPVAERLGDGGGVRVTLVGGEFLFRQSALFGEYALRGVKMHRFDCAFLSAEGVNEEGIWNSTLEIVKYQREVMERSGSNFFLMDRGKFEKRAGELLCGWDQPGEIVVNGGKEGAGGDHFTGKSDDARHKRKNLDVLQEKQKKYLELSHKNKMKIRFCD